MMNSVIEVKEASFYYGEKEVFDKISLSVNSGEILCIVGPNGCGKTTFLDCILGLLKLKKGEIFVNGGNIRNISEKQRAEEMAYIPQSHERTFPYTVEEIVLMGRAHKTGMFSSPSKKDRHIAVEAISKVGIGYLLNKPYTQISGGEGQLVMVARALAQQSRIIIMDEPTAHLDFKNELMLLETITNLIEERAITIIMATHFPNHAYYFENNGIPTTLALMNDGNFKAIGRPSEILNETNIKKIYSVNSKVIKCNIENNISIRQVVPLSIDKEEKTGIRRKDN